ncbi:hypothetical protein PhCBS80983_g01679 [Powellomyces hirtus]|uniref:SWIM-type domain-containing protein n=1 Tax=Powellomyces hirtus TaxID=109895 RepID=A0A507EBS6_9FUNG|nr:hypothetical protein PhCBS80983_g01679 [Powellomyces hirtus]
MSRSRPYRRLCPPHLEQVIEKALESQFYIVQELGPMAMVIKDQQQQEQQQPQGTETLPETYTACDKFKVGLGSQQSCTCASFLRDRELCVHIMWVMQKVFRIPRDSEILYQQSLVEREISELLSSRKNNRAKVKSTCSAQVPGQTSHAKDNSIEPRPIEEGDVCPICQEDLASADAPLTYCKKSCGNHMHVKCVRVLMDHQSRSLGLEQVKCPLCRKDLGSVENLKKQLDGDKDAKEKEKRRKRRVAIHKGAEEQGYARGHLPCLNEGLSRQGMSGMQSLANYGKMPQVQRLQGNPTSLDHTSYPT